jgi:hypothetical protein
VVYDFDSYTAGGQRAEQAGGGGVERCSGGFADLGTAERFDAGNGGASSGAAVG